MGCRVCSLGPDSSLPKTCDEIQNKVDLYEEELMKNLRKRRSQFLQAQNEMRTPISTGGIRMF